MASSSNSSICLSLHHSGFFFEDPLFYDSGQRVTYQDVNFTALDLVDMYEFLMHETNTKITGVYYCAPSLPLHSGLKVLLCDEDIKELIELALENDGKIDMYLDHMYTDLKKYWSKENGEDVSENEVDEDAASLDHLSDGEDELYNVRIKQQGEESKVGEESKLDEKTQNHIADDFFLTELCGAYNSESYVEKEVNTNGEMNQTAHESDGGTMTYPAHNPDIPWDAMRPVVGERYESPRQLKDCLINYGLANGHLIVYEKSDKKRLLARCGKKGKDNGCPWRLWASWMKSKRSFQIKTLVDEHRCSRNFNLKHLIDAKWISKN